MNEKEREARRAKIAASIKEAEDKGLYEISEHLTSQVVLDCFDELTRDIWAQLNELTSTQRVLIFGGYCDTCGDIDSDAQAGGVGGCSSCNDE